MTSNDKRKLDRLTLEKLRIRAIRMVEEGRSPEVVIRELGFSRGRIYEWLAKYRTGGLEALRAKPVPGKPPKMDNAQLARLFQTLAENPPRRLNFPEPLWTRQLVERLIRRDFQVQLSPVSVGRILARLGFCPPLIPLARQGDALEAPLNRWRREEFAHIRAQARRAGGRILFLESAPLSPPFPETKTPAGAWRPANPTDAPVPAGPSSPRLVTEVTQRRISSADGRGSTRFLVVGEPLIATAAHDFLHRLTEGRDRPIFLILVEGDALGPVLDGGRFDLSDPPLPHSMAVFHRPRSLRESSAFPASFN